MICRARVKQSVCGSETMAQRWTLMFWTRLHEAPLRERRSFVQLYAAIGLRKSRTSSGHRHTVRLRLRGSRQSLCSTSQPLRTWKSADPPIAAQMRGEAARTRDPIDFRGRHFGRVFPLWISERSSEAVSTVFRIRAVCTSPCERLSEADIRS